MNLMVRISLVLLALFFAGCETMHADGGGSSSGTTTSSSSSGGSGVTIVKPATASKHQAGDIEVCMETSGYTVEPAKNGVNEGKGHHHLLIDVGLPDLGSPIPKDSNHIHMGDGSKCKTINLGPGNHTITALFAKGNHVPYNPPVTDTVFVYVGHSN